MSVWNGVTMAGTLTTEVPSLHCSLVTFSLWNRLHIDPLPDFKVARSQCVANGQEIFWSDLELGEISLGWEIELKEVTGLRLKEVLESLFPTAYLNRVNTVPLKCLHLRDLAPVNLDHCAGHDLSPFVPEVSHAHLVSDQSHSSSLSRLRSRLLDHKLVVDLVFEGAESRFLISDSVNFRLGKACIVKHFALLKVLLSKLLQISDGHIHEAVLLLCNFCCSGGCCKISHLIEN